MNYKPTTMKTENTPLIHQLKQLITKGNAHVTLEEALKGIPAKLRGVVPDGLPYSLWQIAEHIRITQHDILDFSRNPKYKPKDAAAWNDCIKQIKKDTKEFIALLENKDADLYTPFKWGDGQNLLREAMLIADHTSYHTGEIIVIRRLLGNWKS